MYLFIIYILTKLFLKHAVAVDTAVYRQMDLVARIVWELRIGGAADCIRDCSCN